MPRSSPSKPSLSRSVHGNWKVKHLSAPVFDTFSLHQHDSYEFFLHIRNGSTFRIGDRLIPLQPYQLLVIPPMEVHGIVSDDPLHDYECMYLYIHPEMLQGLSYGVTTLKDVVDPYCRRTSQQVYLSPTEFMHLRGIASLIPSAEDAVSPLDKLEAYGYLTVILSRFCRAITEVNRTVRSASPDLLMQSIHNHILEHYAGDCSLDTLAVHFNISKYHLSRRFSETYGLNLHQFVLRCRINQAQQMIRQGEPLTTLYDHCGFTDYSSFVRAFTRVTGMTPKLWRKQLFALRLSSDLYSITPETARQTDPASGIAGE